MSAFSDLDLAIKEVLIDAAQRGLFPGLTMGENGQEYYTVNPELLHTLQAEFNIHFREPDSTQLKVIK